MSLSDPIGDMLARIKNSQMRNHKKLELPSSKFKTKIAEILKSEGYIIDYEVKSNENKSSLHINLKYNLGNPVINSILPLTSRVGDVPNPLRTRIRPAWPSFALVLLRSGAVVPEVIAVIVSPGANPVPTPTGPSLITE